MGLTYPSNLHAWRGWQRRRNLLRTCRDLVRRPAPPELSVWLRAEDRAAPRLLIALDSAGPTVAAALVAPLLRLSDVPVAVLGDAGVSRLLPGRWQPMPLTRLVGLDGLVEPDGLVGADGSGLAGVRAVAAIGNFLPAGAAAYGIARGLGAEFVVVQHGLLTPYAPPLPAGARLLAFSAADADFWRSGRRDVSSTVVGSQLLWSAAESRTAADPGTDPDTAGGRSGDPPLTFLGQLHGAELGRRKLAVTAERFCRSTGAHYRPHPAETDVRSRLQHRLWRRRGITVAWADTPLVADGRAVVGVFSTGVLEAAAAGLPAWVTCVRPPAWVREFWQRYGLSEWGGEPTPAPPRPAVEPAAAVAIELRRLAAPVGTHG